MLTNKYFIVTVVALLVTAVGYNVWYFTARDEEPASAAASAELQGASGGPPSGGTAPVSRPDTSDATGEGVAPGAVLAAASEGRPALRAGGDAETLATRVEDGTGWGRDPLSRPSAGRDTSSGRRSTPVVAPDWSVSAIVYGENRRSAVIDGRAYREGDGIDGGTVEEIRRGSVVIRWRGRLVTVQLEARAGG